jgi:hypothetical protein
MHHRTAIATKGSIGERIHPVKVILRHIGSPLFLKVPDATPIEPLQSKATVWIQNKNPARNERGI